MQKKSALPNGDQLSHEASFHTSHFNGSKDTMTVEKQKTVGHQKLAMQKKSALRNRDQLSHETSLKTSQFNGSIDTTTSEKQKTVPQQKLAMKKKRKKQFFDTIEIGSSIALFCFGLPKSVMAEGLLLTRGDDNGLCKVAKLRKVALYYVNMEDV